MVPPLAVPPSMETSIVPDAHTLRCSGVEPIDGLMFAELPVWRTVTTVPSSSVWVMFPSCNGTKVSALAAPVERRPIATVAAATTPAALAPWRRVLLFIVPL